MKYNQENLIKITQNVLINIRENPALVLSLTNTVVKPITANLLLSIGAIPVMLQDKEEICEIISNGANSLLINLGTLDKEQINYMTAAIKTANEKNTPWVLDPVAVGALSLRTNFAKEIITQKPAVIRGNPAEIMALNNQASKSRGPDSANTGDEAIDSAIALAKQCNTIVIITGETDYITDGETTISCKNGTPLMTKVTGVGCAMGGLVAACVNAANNNNFHGAIAATVINAIAGELAFKKSNFPGTFAAYFIDAFNEITTETIANMAKIKQV